MYPLADTHSGPSQKSKVDLSVRIATGFIADYFWKMFHNRCLKGSEYASDCS